MKSNIININVQNNEKYSIKLVLNNNNISTDP